MLGMLTLGFSGGLAIGLLLSPSPPSSTPDSLSDMETRRALHDLESSLDELLVASNEIQSMLQAYPVRPTLRSLASASTEAPTCKPSSPPPDDGQATQSANSPDQGQHRSLWIQAIDESLAASLVERGMTPFDRGVATHLQAASNRLRAIESEYLERTAPHSLALSNGELTIKEHSRLCAPARRWRKQERLLAAKAFREALDSLYQSSHGGR